MYDYLNDTHYFAIVGLIWKEMTAIIKKKRIMLLLIAMLFAFGSAVQAAPSKNPPQIRVLLDGKPIQFQAAPVMKNGVTFVQFKPLFQALGYNVDWNSAAKQVTGTLADQELRMKLGSTIAYVNGQKTKLETPPYANAGNTLVPLRFVAESTGLPVKWDAKTRTIKIDRKTVTDLVSIQIKKLYAGQAAALSKGDYKGALAAVHPKSPTRKSHEQSYEEMSSGKSKVSAYVYNVTVAGTSVIATVANTFERTGGAFNWDYTLYKEVLLKKDAAGAWKEYDNGIFDMEYHLPDGLLDAKPEVPEAERTAMMNILQTHYNGINQEDTRLLFSVIAPESPYKKIIDDWLQSGVFKELDFNIHSDSSSIVLYQNDEAVIYTEETDDADGDMYSSSALYWLKKQNGSWLIFDMLEVTE
ncbi:copper amine oxidase N-terminal domain-containing protein [Paenibacillus sp. DMB20]|uniref:copper amine oxidase N-terminal domain-containing protein n=1 Tax=Paenibacillus sp. DMB20 TaxID=1642570 RepID=UPI000A3EDA6E|nr:copper amine oxidase N-terminal domain-containing protein [Paenibacillus sp. DMB20]